MAERSTQFKRKTFTVWILVVALVLTLYLTHKDQIDVEWIRGAVHDNRFLVIPFYLLLLSCLGLTFIPSTPFAIAGVALFDPTFAYVLNLVGIVTSSTIVYHFARFLGLREAFESKYPLKIQKVRGALNRKELPIIVGWSFFPVVPTDLIIYVASTLKIPLWKCLLGVVLGEGALNAIYLFGVNAAL